jgi:hypothetical protein
MPWASTRGKKADPLLTSYAWRQLRQTYAKQLPLPCARCGHMITSARKYLPDGRTNPRSLVLGHRLSRSQGRALGYSEEYLNDPANLRPECWSCSSKQGAHMGGVLVSSMQLAARSRGQLASKSGKWAKLPSKINNKINTEVKQAAAASRW